MITSANLSLPGDFAADSRVWIYQANRPFIASEASRISDLLSTFIADWNSHGHAVKGYARLYYDQFIVLLADETATGVSGCSTDSSVRLIRQIEDETGARLFDRLNLAFLIDKQVRLVAVAQLSGALERGIVTGETLYFNNTVQSKQELETNWLIPLKASWLGPKHLRGFSGVPME